MSIPIFLEAEGSQKLLSLVHKGESGLLRASRKVLASFLPMLVPLCDSLVVWSVPLCVSSARV